MTRKEWTRSQFCVYRHDA